MSMADRCKPIGDNVICQSWMQLKLDINIWNSSKTIKLILSGHLHLNLSLTNENINGNEILVINMLDGSIGDPFKSSPIVIQIIV